MKTFTKSYRRQSTYTCGCCGKLTRETGHGEDSCDLCAFCYLEAGLENSLSDGNIDQAEFDEEMRILRKKYKRAAPTPKENVMTTENTTTESIRSFSARGGATGLLKKLGVNKEDYESFIGRDGERFTVDTEAVALFLSGGADAPEELEEGQPEEPEEGQPEEAETESAPEEAEGWEVENPEAETKRKGKKKERKAKAPRAGVTHADGQTITLLVKENPKRKGTLAFEKFARYKDGMTVASFLAAGGKRSSLRWDSDHGFIEVK